MGKLYGYARVSSREQNLDRQLDALAAFGVADGDVFADRASGRDFDRPEWKRLMAAIGEDDVHGGAARCPNPKEIGSHIIK